MSRTEQLLEAAKKATLPAQKSISIKKWTAIIVELRSKNWTFKEIYDWLREQGERVHDDARVFQAGASRVYNDYLKKLTNPKHIK